MGMRRSELAKKIDHTLLRPEATSARIRTLCAEARAHGFAAVCVNPGWVELAVRELEDSGIAVCTVVDFPLGAGGMTLKREAARSAVAAGAGELDVVIAIGRLLEGDDGYVRDEIAAVVEAASGRPVKAILETALLAGEEIDRACEAARLGGAAFVKTSTGFGPGGATAEAVRRMRAVVGRTMGVKAAGGIRSASAARAMIEAGASRLGTSAALEILEGWEDDDG